MAKNLPGRVVETPPGGAVRGFWKLGRLIARPFSIFEMFFRVRESVSTGLQLTLGALFLVAMFGLWCLATDLPEWVKSVVVTVNDDYRLRVGQEVELVVSREDAKLRAVNTRTGRVGKPLEPPRLAPEAIPALTLANYPGLISYVAEESIGFGAIREVGDGTLEAEALIPVNLRRAQLGPPKSMLQIEKGDPIRFWLENHEVRISAVELGSRAPRWTYQLPEKYRDTPPEELRPFTYERYPELLDALAESVGVQLGRFEQETMRDMVIDKKVIGYVEDPAAADARGLGPRNPQPAISVGERLLLTLDRQKAEIQVLLDRERPFGAIDIPIKETLFSAEAQPAVEPASYPELAEMMLGYGLRVTDSAGVQVSISDLEAARRLGLGLFRPSEIRIISRYTLPSPGEIFEELQPFLLEDTSHKATAWADMSTAEKGLDIALNSRLTRHSLATIWRILVGFSLGVLLGLPLGIAMGAFGKTRYVFEPYHLLLLYLPLPAVTGPLAAAFGAGETFAYGFLAVATTVVVLPFTISCLNQVPDVYVDTGRTLGATRWQIVRRVLVGTSLADIVKGLKLGFAVCFTWVLIAETFGLDAGLGYLLQLYLKRSLTERMYLVIFVIFLLAILFNYLWNKLIYILFPHQRAK